MYYFLLNPSSQSNGSQGIWPRLAEELKQRNIDYKVFATKYAGHAKELAAAITGDDPEATLVAIGGDGTVHEVLCGLKNIDTITFGVIPSGSGNDFAKGLGIPKNPETAFKAILDPQRYAMIDIGEETQPDGQRFGVSCGIGFDASICHEALSSSIKDVLNTLHAGNLTYSAIAVKQIALYEPGPMHISMDGGREMDFSKVYFVAVMNQKYEGGGIKMVPDADPTDGALDVFVCSEISRARFVRTIPAAFFGGHTKLKGCHFMKCTSIEITADKKRPIHLDGESGGIRRELSVRLIPEKLRVICG